MEARPRTTRDFDEWFIKTGDPWGYRDEAIQARLRRTARLLSKYFGANYAGNIVELGAYDGSFTLLLGRTFPNSIIVVNDISKVALDRARDAVSRTPGLSARTQFLLKDSLEIRRHDFNDTFRDNTKPALILLLECLYYLRNGERTQCLGNLGKIFPHAQIAVSSPIGGPPYFTEQELKALGERVGYRCRAAHVLNFRRGSSLPFMHAIGDKVGFLRRSLANQVLYIFAPK